MPAFPRFFRAALLYPLLLALPCGVHMAAAQVMGEYTVPTSPLQIYVTPEGNGSTLAQVGVVDVFLYDNAGPVVGLPASNIEMYVVAGDGLACTRFFADGPTDAQGHTTFSGTFAGGGSSQIGLEMWAVGEFLPWAARIGELPVPIHFNSPDINADGRIDLADLGEFAYDYAHAYRFRSDYDHDGVLNLADVGIFAQHLGEACN